MRRVQQRFDQTLNGARVPTTPKAQPLGYWAGSTFFKMVEPTEVTRASAKSY
jgi:hypothetical protein